MKLTLDQRAAVAALSRAFAMATESDLFDELVAHSLHPDQVNAVCDGLASFIEAHGGPDQFGGPQARQAPAPVKAATPGEGLFELGVSIGDQLKNLFDADKVLQARGKPRALIMAWSAVQFGAASALLPSMVDVPNGESALKSTFGSGAEQALSTYAELGPTLFELALRRT